MEAEWIKPGVILRHVPTGRLVVVVEVTEHEFTVHTVDDIWVDPKDLKLKGGCSWTLLREREKEFQPEGLYVGTVEHVVARYP